MDTLERNDIVGEVTVQMLNVYPYSSSKRKLGLFVHVLPRVLETSILIINTDPPKHAILSGRL